jgi:uncharacterized protein YdhG (YjbR/CyaY superfamily)
MKTVQKVPTTIDAYIAGYPAGIQAILNKIRATIQKAAPEAQEAIKYQMPTFTLNGNLVHFAAFKNHIGFYPTPSGVENFKKELSPYQTAKGSIQFPLDKPIPYGLISRIVKLRVKESSAAAAAKAAAKAKAKRTNAKGKNARAKAKRAGEK